MTFRPMLAAAAADNYRITAPVLASPKLDGVRATILKGVAVSRSGKAIPNRAVQELVAARPWMEGMDGEFIFGDPTASDAFRNTSSAVMSIRGSADNVVFHAFDWFVPAVGFNVRYATLRGVVEREADPFVRLVPHTLVSDQDVLDEFEAHVTGMGYEGVMVRDPHGVYKHGRSTLREAGLIKIKRFVDFEARILGAEARNINTNVQERDELGYAKRSTAKDGMVPTDELGALLCITPDGVEFSVGSGFTADERRLLWQAFKAGTLVGMWAKVKSFPVGVKNAPRFPVYLGLRSELDMGE